MNRYLCIHSHFYQPPRENPWLEEVELQDSAYPYHDWNQRITAECYAANTASRILDEDQRIIDIVNNYSKISFNFGPKLLSWMERARPNVYQAILDADGESLKRFSGHGGAMAQAYNHMIMPLANERDARTQVIWGIKDFEFRFKRKPEGMWLPETAVDIKTLEVLAEFGIKFTVLAPHQAKRVRKVKSKDWKDVQGGKIDPQTPYLCRLPSGRKIHLFFYDGPISQEVAFSELLKNGQGFAGRLIGVFPEKHEQSRLIHIATDGETYGHHHRYGDMALSYCLHHIESNKLANITVYGQYLATHPTDYEVEIEENTSWSCSHGIERWQADCGCCIGGHDQWTQSWRAPLRAALDWLRDALVLVFEEEMAMFTRDPWAVRDKYIRVVLARKKSNIERFLRGNTEKDLSEEDKVRILKLLEMQRHAMLMYTSCGWFFDEVSGIEAQQIIQYAARAIQLAEEVSGVTLEEEFVQRLNHVPSNVPEVQTAATIYEQFVKPAKVDLLRVGAHYAVSSLFEKYSDETNIYCYLVKKNFHESWEAGKQKIIFGKAEVCSRITLEARMMSFCVLHFGDHNLNGGVRIHMGDDAFDVMRQETKEAFAKSDIPAILALMNKHFGMHNYSLWHLFKYEQKVIFDKIFSSGLQEIEAHYRRIYQEYYPSMQARKDLNIPLPKALSGTLEFVLSRDLLRLLEEEVLDIKKFETTAEEMQRWAFEVDKTTLGYVATKKINALMKQFLSQPKGTDLLKLINDFLNILKRFSLDLDIGKAQNMYFQVGQQRYKKMKKKAEQADKLARQWLELFEQLGRFLRVKTS